MVLERKVIVVMPAFNAEKTLKDTYEALPLDIVDEVILVDDCSGDATCDLAKSVGIKNVIRHASNLGYGSNQKTCYRTALESGADIVVMVHPDYQYEPRLVRAMVSMLDSGVYDCVLASRFLGNGPLRGGMPRYKYVFNRLLTALQNIIIPYSLSEYHTGFRAFTRQALTGIDFVENSDNFVFDNQIILQVIGAGFRVGEISCPTKYEADCSSISFRQSIRYGLGVVLATFEYKLSKARLLKSRRFGDHSLSGSLNNR